MNDATTLREKLDQIGHEIDQMQARLKLKGIYNADHELKLSELMERRSLLDKELADEVKDMEQQGQKVSNLHKSVMNWVNEINFDS